MPPPPGGGPGARALLATLSAAGSLMPPALLGLVARQVARLVRLASPALRLRLDRNARHLLGEVGPTPRTRSLALAQLEGFARFTSEIAVLGLRPGRVEQLLGGVEGAENLARAEEARRGMVVVTLHFGNYELAAAVLAKKSSGGVAVVYHQDPSRGWEERRRRFREEAGQHMVNTGFGL